MLGQRTSDSDETHKEHAFDESAYTFMTFLYAAAVHLVIAKAYEGQALGKASDLFLLCLILFLFSDWASRARLPRLLQENPAGYLYVCKISLEIVCIFFLVSSFLLLVASHTDATLVTDTQWPWQAFGWFLVATGCWDYLMIYIMDELQFIPLAKCVWWSGRSIDMDVAHEYLGKFASWKHRRKAQIEAARSDAREKLADGQNHPIPVHASNIIREIRDGFDVHFFEAAISGVTQFVAAHVLQANVVAGAALILNARWLKKPVLDALFGSTTPIYDQLQFGPTWHIAAIGAALFVCLSFVSRRRRWAIGALVVLLLWLFRFSSSVALLPWLKLSGLVAAVFVLSTLAYSWRGTRLETKANRIGGLILVVLLTLLYLVLPSHLLVALLATQQVLVNIFLQFGISTKTRPGDNGRAGSDQALPNLA